MFVENHKNLKTMWARLFVGDEKQSEKQSQNNPKTIWVYRTVSSEYSQSRTSEPPEMIASVFVLVLCYKSLFLKGELDNILKTVPTTLKLLSNVTVSEAMCCFCFCNVTENELF